MAETLHRIREIATRIRRLQIVLKHFHEGRRSLERLQASSEGAIRTEIEQALATNQAAIEVRERDLQALESERAQLLSQLALE